MRGAQTGPHQLMPEEQTMDTDIINALVADDYRARLRAIGLIEEQEVRDAVPRSIDLLRDKEMPVRAAAASTLGTLGDRRAVEPLIASLGDPMSVVRRAAMRALSRLRDERMRDPIMRILRSDPSFALRLEAVATLTALKDDAVLSALQAALTDADDDVRAAAALALAQIGDARAPPPLREMAARDGGEYWDVASNVAEANATAAQHAIQQILSRTTDEA